METGSAIEIIEGMRSRGAEVFVDTPASDAAIELLERQMRAKLPSDLMEFIRRFGSIALGDAVVSGILGDHPLSKEGGNILNDTEQLRSAHSDLPATHWVISVHEDGAFCLDYSVGGDPVVVNFERGHSSKVSESFSEFIANYFPVLGT